MLFHLNDKLIIIIFKYKTVYKQNKIFYCLILQNNSFFSFNSVVLF